MSNDDSGDGDRTVFRPTPGGRRRTPSAPTPPPAATPPPPAARPAPAPAAHAPSPTPAPSAGGAPPRALGSGINPLVDAAGALLSLATQFRSTTRHPDPGGLRNHVVQEVKAFEAAAKGAGCPQESVLPARYCLCTFIDETVLSTPWGSQSGWSQQTLLSGFHNEGYGGEKFFAILEKCNQDPAKNLHLIELLFVCLSLGFQGKYRVVDNGQQALDRVKDSIYQTIRQQRGEFERELSPNWRGAQDVRNPLAKYLPLWVVAALAGVLCLFVFVALNFALSDKSQPVNAELRTLGRDAGQLVARETTAPLRTADLAGFLAPEIQAGLVTVTDAPGRSTVVINGSGLFASGSARLEGARLPLIARIAEGLNTVAGSVTVTGHTDSDPVPRSLRLKFASNWELSQQRAEAVVRVLADGGVPESRLTADGRADTEPVVANDTPANKALNRRVEIILTTGRVHS
ncbi:MAG: type IVB secretion system protein IcmH/DotU [Pseudomonadota bacterium]